MTHTLDIAAFRAAFPQFQSEPRWPDAYIQSAWDAAVIFLGDKDNCRLQGDAKQLALELFTAHQLATQGPVQQAAAGASPALGALTGATVDKVSVQRVAPPIKSMWAYWLSSSPYGVQLYALLRTRVAGGYYAIGRNEGAGFRRGAPARFRR